MFGFSRAWSLRAGRSTPAPPASESDALRPHRQRGSIKLHGQLFRGPKNTQQKKPWAMYRDMVVSQNWGPNIDPKIL